MPLSALAAEGLAATQGSPAWRHLHFLDLRCERCTLSASQGRGLQPFSFVETAERAVRRFPWSATEGSASPARTPSLLHHACGARADPLLQRAPDGDQPVCGGAVGLAADARERTSPPAAEEGLGDITHAAAAALIPLLLASAGLQLRPGRRVRQQAAQHGQSLRPAHLLSTVPSSARAAADTARARC